MIKSLLYPLIGSALVTITPFLLTFEKGQDIVRGIFGFSVFVLLLLFVYVCHKFRGVLRIAFLCVVVVTLFVIAWMDLQNLLAIKGWGTGWYGILPFATVILALVMQKPIKAFSIHAISFIVFVTLFAHLAWQNYYPVQPFAAFPVVEYLNRTAPKPVPRKFIRDDFKAKYTVAHEDSVTITKNFLDSSRTNVVVLVESWGIRLDTALFARDLQAFAGIPQQVGAHNRMYSRTRTAEREDLIMFFVRDSITRRRDTTFIPQVYAAKGAQTTFLFGGDSLEHWRYKYIRNVGFQNLIFGAYLTTDSSTFLPDSVMAGKLDSLLNTAATSGSQFIAWTTRDTKFPLQGIVDTYGTPTDVVDSAYNVRLSGTLNLVAELARKHPDVRFIVQGDHNPILSPLPFQERFYKRWVPYIILN